MKTISFSILFSILQLFLNPLFFAFLQQFTAGENLKVAGDSTGRRRILTTLPVICNFNCTQSRVTAKLFSCDSRLCALHKKLQFERF